MENRIFNRNSISVRIFIIIFLVLVLMIPSAMITALVNERQARKNEAITEITSKWAGAQIVGGPMITVPYDERWKDEQGKIQSQTGYIQLLPDSLEITGNLQPQIRYRGIYKAVLYNVKVKVQGSFSFGKLENLNIPQETIHWNESFLSVLIPDMRGIRDNIDLFWNGQKYPLEPGIKKGNTVFDSGVSVKIPLAKEASTLGSSQFRLNLNLNGSEEFNLLPLGKKTVVNITSSWKNPSFDGTFLPEKRRVDQQGFTAYWKVLDLNRNYSQQWTGDSNKESVLGSKFGLKLFSPVDEYTQTTRAVKYLVMFVGLTFLVFFLLEVFNKKRIHPIQYLLIGMALCIFYLLLLSLSEHLTFELAYIIAGLCITVLIAWYARNALGGRTITLITGLLLAILYTFMYVLLQNQDYALLIGSIGLFAIIAAVMYFSRDVDWYKIELNN